MPTLYKPSESPWDKEIALAIKALGNVARFEILLQMADRPWFKSADIIKSSELSATMVSKNLVWLEENGLIECDVPKGERKGRRPNYRVLVPNIRAALLAVLDAFPEGEWKRFDEIEKPDPTHHES